MAREHAVPAGGWRSRATAAVAVLAVAVVVARPAQADDAHVAMRGVAFVPATVSVRQTAGEPTSPAPHAHVIWTNEDPGTEHTVTFEDPRPDDTRRGSRWSDRSRTGARSTRGWPEPSWSRRRR